MSKKAKNVIDSFKGDHKFLSNFHPCKVKLDDVEYPSVEHAYQAAKTLDVEERRAFHEEPLPTAAQSKKLGKALTMRPDWDTVKLQVMEGLLVQKFADPELRKMLNNTGTLKLVEGNYWGDTFWGVDHEKGGKNHLGLLLMKIRDGS